MNRNKVQTDQSSLNVNSINNSNRVVIILLSITIIILITMSSFFGFLYFNASKKPAEEKTNKPKVAVKAEKTVDLDEFVLNLADDNPRYIKIKITLAFVDTNTTKDIESKLPQVRHVVNTYIWSKKTTDFEKANLNKLVEELKVKLNAVITKGSITNIYIKDILIS